MIDIRQLPQMLGIQNIIWIIIGSQLLKYMVALLTQIHERTLRWTGILQHDMGRGVLNLGEYMTLYTENPDYNIFGVVVCAFMIFCQDYHEQCRQLDQSLEEFENLYNVLKSKLEQKSQELQTLLNDDQQHQKQHKERVKTQVHETNQKENQTDQKHSVVSRCYFKIQECVVGVFNVTKNAMLFVQNYFFQQQHTTNQPEKRDLVGCFRFVIHLACTVVQGCLYFLMFTPSSFQMTMWESIATQPPTPGLDLLNLVVILKLVSIRVSNPDLRDVRDTMCGFLFDVFLHQNIAYLGSTDKHTLMQETTVRLILTLIVLLYAYNPEGTTNWRFHGLLWGLVGSLTLCAAQARHGCASSASQMVQWNILPIIGTVVLTWLFANSDQFPRQPNQTILLAFLRPVSTHTGLFCDFKDKYTLNTVPETHQNVAEMIAFMINCCILVHTYHFFWKEKRNGKESVLCILWAIWAGVTFKVPDYWELEESIVKFLTSVVRSSSVTEQTVCKWSSQDNLLFSKWWSDMATWSHETLVGWNALFSPSS